MAPSKGGQPHLKPNGCALLRVGRPGAGPAHNGQGAHHACPAALAVQQAQQVELNLQRLPPKRVCRGGSGGEMRWAARRERCAGNRQGGMAIRICFPPLPCPALAPCPRACLLESLQRVDGRPRPPAAVVHLAVLDCHCAPLGNGRRAAACVAAVVEERVAPPAQVDQALAAAGDIRAAPHVAERQAVGQLGQQLLAEGLQVVGCRNSGGGSVGGGGGGGDGGGGRWKRLGAAKASLQPSRTSFCSVSAKRASNDAAAVCAGGRASPGTCGCSIARVQMEVRSAASPARSTVGMA